MPVAHLLTSMDATVTVCHSRTADLPAHVARADIVIAAIGRAEMVEAGWLKPGAVVIDVRRQRNSAQCFGACGSAHVSDSVRARQKKHVPE